MQVVKYGKKINELTNIFLDILIEANYIILLLIIDYLVLVNSKKCY